MDISANSLGHPLAVMSEAADHYEGVHQYDLAARMRNARSMVSLHDETLAILRRSYSDELAKNARLKADVAELIAERDELRQALQAERQL
jgi:hypothetical protein